MRLPVAEAAERLDELVDLALAGEEVVIFLEDGTTARIEPIWSETIDGSGATVERTGEARR